MDTVESPTCLVLRKVSLFWIDNNKKPSNNQSTILRCNYRYNAHGLMHRRSLNFKLGGELNRESCNDVIKSF